MFIPTWLLVIGLFVILAVTIRGFGEAIVGFLTRRISCSDAEDNLLPLRRQPGQWLLHSL